jgi:hypothetical protein
VACAVFQAWACLPANEHTACRVASVVYIYCGTAGQDGT